MKIDPHHSKRRYVSWKKEGMGLPGISESNAQLIREYLNDMERGINVSRLTKRGGRSYMRLNTLRSRMHTISKMLETNGHPELSEVTEQQILSFFHDMRTGVITKDNGKKYKSTQDYEKVFKAFWRWLIKSRKKQGKIVQDITVDVGGVVNEKPNFVYFTVEELKLLCDAANYKYRVLMHFLFDTGIRSPTELMNVKVSDLYSDCKELNIQDEYSKTFGRKIKLMLSSDILKDYIKQKELKGDDYLFPISPRVVNQYLKNLGKRVFKGKKTLGGGLFSELTMYDFRHSSCCYWLPRYKSESALKYRFGWKKSRMIHYYSNLLGMRDTISEDDLYVDITKTELEKQITSLKHEVQLQKERHLSEMAEMKKMIKQELMAEVLSEMKIKSS